MENYPKILHLKNNPFLEGQLLLKSNIIYSIESGVNLTLDIILPWSVGNPALPQKKYPLIVFVQGSGWTTPDRGYEIPQLCTYAREGCVVATVGHRDYQNGHPFPAYLEDVKCAIRYLRKNTDSYCIDPERVAIWGTSSGGNTALLVGLTADEPRYETSEHAGYSDGVCAVVSCFGPADMQGLLGQHGADQGISDLLSGIYGPESENWPDKMREMSPVCHVDSRKSYPPFLLLQGDADPLVSLADMEKMYHKLLDGCVSVEAYQVDGAEHEGNFWSKEVHDVIRSFLKRHLEL